MTKKKENQFNRRTESEPIYLTTQNKNKKDKPTVYFINNNNNNDDTQKSMKRRKERLNEKVKNEKVKNRKSSQCIFITGRNPTDIMSDCEFLYFMCTQILNNKLPSANYLASIVERCEKYGVERPQRLKNQ
jgi:hypothetical protein